MQPVAIDHFRHYRFIRHLRTNGRGCAAFLVRRANLKQNRYDSALWLYQNGQARPTAARGEVGAFWWHGPDRIVFATPGTRADKALRKKGLPCTVLQSLRISRPDDIQPFLRLDVDVEDLAFLPDGRLLVVAAWSAAVDAALAAAQNDPGKAAALLQKAADVEVMCEAPVWANGAGFTSAKRSRLYLWEKGRLRPLTDEETGVEALRLSPSGRSAFFIAQRYATVRPATGRLFRLNTATLQAEAIGFENDFRYDACVPLSDDAAVFFGSDMARHGLNQNPGLYRWQAGHVTPLDTSGRYDCTCSVGTDLSMPAPPQPFVQGGQLHWVATVGDASALMRTDATTGHTTCLSTAPGAVFELAPGENGCFVTAMRGLFGPELYAVDATGGETPCTALNRRVQAAFHLEAPRPLCFANPAGVQISGWVLRPPALTEGTRCAAILYIHGGPKAVYGTVAFHEMQYLAAQGFAVLCCNPTGSDGRGDAFADIRGRLGTVDYDDLMAFVDAALAQHSWIDPGRLGVAGGSYGGFMVNWIIGHTRRFAAAVSQRGISSWGSMALTSDIGHLFAPDYCAADPLQDPAAVWAQSPLKYANCVATPTLFIHSQQDHRCPWGEALQLYTALQLAGVPTRLCLFRGENHELSRSGKPRSRLRRLEEIIRWFRQYL
ncbi:MAG: alpha/beta hydrolase family protein [Oscillospiraceae bacterium]